MPLTQLVYFSEATHLFNTVELNALQAECRQTNEEREVTGILLYNGGYFMQVLEGELATLTELYASIYKDKRHRNVSLIFHEQVDRRYFGHWRMGMLNLERNLEFDRSWFDEIVERYTGTRAVLPSQKMVLLTREFLRQIPPAAIVA